MFFCFSKWLGAQQAHLVDIKTFCEIVPDLYQLLYCFVECVCIFPSVVGLKWYLGFWILRWNEYLQITVILFEVSFLDSDFSTVQGSLISIFFLFPSALWFCENKQKKNLWTIEWIVGRCLWIASGWAAGENGGDCKVKRQEIWPWEMQSEGETGLPSLKGNGNDCFHPEMYIHSWRQGGFHPVFQN